MSFLASSGLEETIELDGIVLDIPFDVIVGEPDIIRYDLLPIVMARYSRQDTCLLGPEEGIITRTLEGPEVACSCQAGGIIDHTADKDEVELTSSPTCSSCLSLCYLAHDAREGKPSCVGREQAQPDLALSTRMSLEGTTLVFHETSAIPPRQQLLASSVPPFLNSVNDFHRFSICPGSESIGPGSQPICPSSKPILNLRPVADQSWKIYGKR